MVLIVGGAAQGKLDFAREKLGVTAWSDGVLGPESCVRSLHRALRDLPDPREALAAWLREHPEGVLICDEVGCGVTPLDRGSGNGGSWWAGSAASWRRGPRRCTGCGADWGRG